MARISRRRFIEIAAKYIVSMGTIGAVNLLPPLSRSQEVGEQELRSDMTADEWMDKLQSTLGLLSGSLHVSRFVEPFYYLTKPISWIPNATQTKRVNPVVVPKGFVTDFASIPRVFWSTLRPDGEYAYAAIIHDYLYWVQAESREDADLVFKLGMENLGVGAAKISLIYNAVRIFGSLSWDENERLKRKGEKRILRVFPDDPVARWEDWKLLPEVFE